MKNEEVERLNTLSEKAINGNVTPNELKEFQQLLDAWNESTKYNLLQGIYIPNSKGSLF